jgi:hypothetical protein
MLIVPLLPIYDGLNIFYFISMEGLVGLDKMQPTFCFKSFYTSMTTLLFSKEGRLGPLELV